MRNKIYEKSILREILYTKARFISILLIIFLGVAFYAGIKSTGPDMDKSINEYYKNQNLMDSKVISSLGLTDKDLDLLKNNDKIRDYYGSHTIDANLTNLNSVVRFMEYNPKNNINKYEVLEGRLPENSGEIAIDKQALNVNKDIKIGDIFTIDTDKDTMKSFKKKTYKIVGIVKSPMYIEKESRGATNVGKGAVDYFTVVNSNDISMDVYTEIYVRFKNLENLDTYFKEYKAKIEENNKYLEKLYAKRKIDRVEEIKADAQVEIDKAAKEIEDGKNQLQEGKDQYEKGVADYEKNIKAGDLKLSQGKKALDKAQKEIDKQREILAAGEVQLVKAKEEIDKAKQEFLNQGINPDEDTSSIKGNVENLNNLKNTYSTISSDIKNTVNNLEAGSDIPSDKIQYWKSIISNQSLGLTDLVGLVNELEKQPSNISLANNLASSIDSASKKVETNISNLNTLLAGITSYQQGKKQYEEQITTFNNGKVQLQQGQEQITKAKAEIIKGEKELEKGKTQGKIELDKAKQEIVKGEKELAEGEEKLNDEKEKLNELTESKYMFFNRNDNPGHSSLGDSIKSLDNIASVLPVFFFLVAILICLTTMTRMVEENRIEMGTLKALGYNNIEISKKYVIYASLASISGSVLGILIGCSVLPYIISDAYGSLFSLPKLTVYYYPLYIIQSIGISILCTAGATIFVLWNELKSSPSNLMKPKAPKLGKKIILERITPLWNRFSFKQKVTFRNIFRYL